MYLCRHLEQFWGASKAFFSDKWTYVYQLSGENDFIMYVLGKFYYNNILVQLIFIVLGTQAITIIAFWTANLLFMLLDLSGRPQYLHKYKIQEEKNVPVSLCYVICKLNILVFHFFR